MQIPQNLDSRHEYPDMVRWFSPMVLLKTVRKVVASTLFAQYADRRLIHASLDRVEARPTPFDTLGAEGFRGDDEGAVWVDYVADLGDGFDSTYAIAYLVAQRRLPLASGELLPRAHALVMGGDQVYPDASRYDYEARMQRPYRYAFPDSKAAGADHPLLFLIPGNHDWYDGLTLFLAKFCRGRPTALGSWRAVQHRSYFALRLADNWWVWGYDSQLGEDIDRPQADFFVDVAKKMPTGARVILCASVPTWLEAELRAADPAKREAFYRGLDYVAGILKNECKDAKIPIVLSGDLHHYSRYVADKAGTQFITAGGGGAFLHPTHQLPDAVNASWVGNAQTLQLAKVKRTADGPDEEACYPSREASRHLAWGNAKFISRNFDFVATLGALYFVTALLLLAWGGYGVPGASDTYFGRACEIARTIMATPVFVMAAVIYYLVMTRYADIQPDGRRRIVGGLHALAHLAIVVSATSLLAPLLAPLRALPLGEILYFAGLGAGFLAAGIVGGLVWGCYLLAISFLWGMHANDAFSAMRLGSHRHFLRLKIKGDELTVYPIGIDKEPRRSVWIFNNAYREGGQDEPVLKPSGDLGQRLIEPAVVIDATAVQPLRRVAPT